MTETKAPPRLLVVEDDPDIGDILLEFLLAEGYPVERARSIEEAVEMVGRCRYDLVISDLFARTPRDAPASVTPLVAAASPVPVGVITGWAVKMEAFASPRPAFVKAKPLDFTEFLALVSQALAPGGEAEAAVQQLVRDYFAALSLKDWGLLGRLCTEDVVYALPSPGPLGAYVVGREAFLLRMQDIFRHFPDALFEEVAVYPTAGGAAARFQARFTNPAGQPVIQSGAVAFGLRQLHIERIGVALDTTRLKQLAQNLLARAS
jgi:CheY-like chemotaxis protein/ketosteroid isomerase-like protein